MTKRIFTGCVSLAGCLLLAVAAGCGSDKTRSLLPIDIEPGDAVGIGNVRIYVKQGDVDVHMDQLAWDAPAGQTAKFGLYLSRDVSGAVTVEATGHDATDATVGVTQRASATITPGKAAALVTLRMMKSSGMGVDGGAPPSGDAAAPGLDMGGAPDLAAPGDGPTADAAAPDVMGAPDTGPDAAVGPSWKPAENLENDIVNGSYWPAVAMDAQGNTLVAWNETNAVKVRRYDAATRSWQAAKTLESTGSINEVALRMSPDGRATAMWNQSPVYVMGGREGVWASHSKDGGNTWSPPKQVHSGPMYGEIELAVAANGDARAAWEETPRMPNVRSLWSAYYDDATGVWSDAAVVRMGEDTDDRYQKIAMDSQGNGLLVWSQDDPMGLASTWVAPFTAKQPLKTPQMVDTDTMNGIDDPAVAMMPDGSRGIVVWGQDASGGTDLMVSEWTPAGGFGAPTKAFGNSTWTGAHAVVIDHAATVTLAWTQPLAGGRANLVAMRRLAGQPWGEVTPLETTNQSPGETDKYPYPDMALDSVGNVHVAWARKMMAPATDSTYAAVVRRFAAGKWEPEVMVGSKARLRAWNPAIAVSRNGTAAVTWYYGDPHNTDDKDTYNVFVALFQ